MTEKISVMSISITQRQIPLDLFICMAWVFISHLVMVFSWLTAGSLDGRAYWQGG